MIIQGIVGCTPTNVPRHGKSLYKPYSSWVFMGFFIPKNPKVEHNFHTMVVHVRERCTRITCPLNHPDNHPKSLPLALNIIDVMSVIQPLSFTRRHGSNGFNPSQQKCSSNLDHFPIGKKNPQPISGSILDP